MNFYYRAVNSSGGVVTGETAAPNMRTAVRRLNNKGLHVLAVEGPRKSPAPVFAGESRPGVKDKHIALHQLCVLIESGVTLEEAVSSLAESRIHPSLNRWFSKIDATLRGGGSFSDAIRDSTIGLPEYFYPLAQAGELTGAMASALRDGVSQWEYEIETANEFRNALLYPLILTLSGVAAIIIIFTMVVPKFTRLLDKSGDQAPFLAQVVLGAGQWFNSHSLPAGGFVAGLSLIIVFVLINPEMRKRCINLLIHIPVLKDWLIEADISRWAALIATLLENRVPLLKSLELASDYVRLESLRSRLIQAAKFVKSGVSLSSALKEMEAVTPVGVNLIQVGERSGELPAMLKSLSGLYGKSCRTRMKRLLIIIEPVTILIIGAVIGLIMAGIISAITSANNISFR